MMDDNVGGCACRRGYTKQALWSVGDRPVLKVGFWDVPSSWPFFAYRVPDGLQMKPWAKEGYVVSSDSCRPHA